MVAVASGGGVISISGVSGRTKGSAGEGGLSTSTTIADDSKGGRCNHSPEMCIFSQPLYCMKSCSVVPNVVLT